MPRFLADRVGITSCANKHVGKDFDFYTAIQLDPILKIGLTKVKFYFPFDINASTRFEGILYDFAINIRIFQRKRLDCIVGAKMLFDR